MTRGNSGGQRAGVTAGKHKTNARVPPEITIYFQIISNTMVCILTKSNSYGSF
jgi:hypothetical protein